MIVTGEWCRNEYDEPVFQAPVAAGFGLLHTHVPAMLEICLLTDLYRPIRMPKALAAV